MKDTAFHTVGLAFVQLLHPPTNYILTSPTSIYMFIITAAPPKSAAAPIAPVFIGIAIPELELDDPDPDPEDPAAALVAALFAAPPPEVLIADVGVGTPEVNGALLAELAPEKAGDPLVELVDAVLLAGLRTLSITWITPLATSTFGTVTAALFTKTVPLAMVILILPPSRVFSVVLLSRVLYPTVPLIT
jgi:hypothetical protein